MKLPYCVFVVLTICLNVEDVLCKKDVHGRNAVNSFSNVKFNPQLNHIEKNNEITETFSHGNKGEEESLLKVFATQLSKGLFKVFYNHRNKKKGSVWKGKNTVSHPDNCFHK